MTASEVDSPVFDRWRETSQSLASTISAARDSALLAINADADDGWTGPAGDDDALDETALCDLFAELATG